MSLADIWDNIAGTGHWQRQINSRGASVVLELATGNVAGATVDTARLDAEKAAFVIRHIENRAGVTKPLHMDIGVLHWAMAVAARQNTRFLRTTLVPFAKKFFWERELTHAVTILAPLVGNEDWASTRAVLETANYKMPVGEFIALADRTFSQGLYEFSANLVKSIYPANTNWVFDDEEKEQLTQLARKAAAEVVSLQNDAHRTPGLFLTAAVTTGLSDHISVAALEEIRELISNVPDNDILKKSLNGALAKRYFAETEAIITEELPALARNLVAIQTSAAALVEKLDAHARKIGDEYGDTARADEIRDTATSYINPFVDAVQAISSQFGYHKIGEKNEAAPPSGGEQAPAARTAAASPKPPVA